MARSNIGGYTPPLDGLASKVLTAWAAFRLFTGNAESLRVRESGASTEADIGTLAAGGFDTTAFATHVGAGNGFAAKAYDQNGSNDFVQATAATQPQVNLTGINSKPSLTFSGAQKIVTPALTWTTVFTDGFEFWVLAKFGSSALTGADCAIGARGNYSPEFYCRAGSQSKPAIWTGVYSRFDTTLVAGTTYLIRFYYHGGVWRCDVNGTTEATTHTVGISATSSVPFTLGSDGGTGDYLRSGEISGVILFKQALTAGEASALTTALKTLGGIP